FPQDDQGLLHMIRIAAIMDDAGRADPQTVVRLETAAKGPAVPVVFATTTLVALVKPGLAERIDALAHDAVQWLNVTVDGKPSDYRYMHILHKYDCYDRETCGDPDTRPVFGAGNLSLRSEEHTSEL